MARIRLYHGTDWQSANDILVNGLDAAKAARYNGGGEFWATTDILVAEWFARTNPSSGSPACFGFELDNDALQQFCGILPGVVVVHGAQDYEFLPESFPMLNAAMTNLTVQVIT